MGQPAERELLFTISSTPDGFELSEAPAAANLPKVGKIALLELMAERLAFEARQLRVMPAEAGH